MLVYDTASTLASAKKNLFAHPQFLNRETRTMTQERFQQVDGNGKTIVELCSVAVSPAPGDSGALIGLWAHDFSGLCQPLQRSVIRIAMQSECTPIRRRTYSAWSLRKLRLNRSRAKLSRLKASSNQFDNNSRNRSNSVSDKIFSRDRVSWRQVLVKLPKELRTCELRKVGR